MPARVRSQTACRLLAPRSTASTICALDTALQSQICVSSAICSGARSGTSIGGGNSSSERRSASGRSSANACATAGHQRSVADEDRANEPVVADDQLLVDAPGRLRVADDLVVFVDGVPQAHDGDVESGHFELRGEP